MNEGERDNLLSRIDERSRHMEAEIIEIKKRFADLVTRVEFIPVRLIAFGMVGMLAGGVIAAVIAALVTGRR